MYRSKIVIIGDGNVKFYRTLIFVEHKRDADVLAIYISCIFPDIKATTIHGFLFFLLTFICIYFD